MKFKKLLLAYLIAGLFLLPALGLAQRESEARQRSVVGKLAKVTEQTSIYLKPNKKSRIIYKAPKDLYIVLKALDDNWATVVMSDNSNGYIEAKFIERLPYEVSVEPEPQAVMNRGSFDRDQASVSTGSDFGSQIIRDAYQYIGTRYVWGGNDLLRGVDCSGYVRELFKRYGINLPRTAAEQSLVGQLVPSLSDLRAGDRLYFCNTERTRISHTGLYIGDGYFIHSSSNRNCVGIDKLEGRYLNTLVVVRR